MEHSRFLVEGAIKTKREIVRGIVAFIEYIPYADAVLCRAHIHHKPNRGFSVRYISHPVKRPNARRLTRKMREAIESQDAEQLIAGALAILEQRARYGSALTSPNAVRDYLKLTLAGRERESFICVYLDAQHRVMDFAELFAGTLTQTSVYPREVVKAALGANAAAVIFAHNHPSGVAQPSQADELLTRQLKEALALVDVKVLDHFIVAGSATVSFAERGLI